MRGEAVLTPQRVATSVYLAAAAALGLAVGCGSPGPCYGLAPGSRLAITVIEPYDQNSQFTLSSDFSPTPGCGFGFDLAQGTVLQTTVASNASANGCHPAVLTVAPFGSWTWTLDGSLIDPMVDGLKEPLAGHYSAVGPACSGSVGLLFNLVSGDPLQPSVPGQLPHVVLQRAFTPDGSTANAAACRACDGFFVVNLQRL